MVTKHLTDSSLLPPEQAAVLATAGIPERMPFLLDQDGSYVEDANKWLRWLPSTRAKSDDTWNARATDAMTWIRFLKSRGKTLWEATQDDVAAYYSVRRRGAQRIAASTWDRGISSLDSLYSWGVAQGLVAKAPFDYVYLMRLAGDHSVAVAHNTSKESAGEPDVKFLSIAQYQDFRSVGLMGTLPDGRPDPRFRGRMVHRNVTYADMLVTSGMRVQESTVTLLPELRAALAAGGRNRLQLPAAICKGGKRSREIPLTPRVARQLADYVDIERSGAVARAQAAGRYDRTALRVVADAKRSRGIDRTTGERISWSSAPSEQRRLLAVQDDDAGTVEPLALWLSERGLPMSENAWAKVFSAASERCQDFGIEVDVHPHMLRHTFAVNMLTSLVRAQLQRLGQDPQSRYDAAYVKALGDPLRRLQKMLGHASVTTTEKHYLGHVEEAQDLVDEALDAFADELLPPGQDDDGWQDTA